MNTDFSVLEFSERFALFIREFLPHCLIEVTEQNSLRLKARVRISLAMFIDIFYAMRTGKISIALVLEGKRVFGIDNLGGWHVHPVGENQAHHRIEEPSLEEALRRCVEAANALQRNIPT